MQTYEMPTMRSMVERLSDTFRSFKDDSLRIPELVENLWPKVLSVDNYNTGLSTINIFNSQLYLDRVKVSQDPGQLRGESSIHFYQYRIASHGLEAKALGWDSAREILYDAISSPKPEMLTSTYLLWMNTLAKFTDRENLSASMVNKAEAWNDRIVLESKVIQGIREQKSSGYRAFLVSSFLNAVPISPASEVEALVTSETNHLLSTLPRPKDFAGTYQHIDDLRVFRNDLFWITSLANTLRDKGFDQFETSDGEMISLIDNYLLQVIEHYNPELGDPYVTASLLEYAKNEFVPQGLRTTFVSSVEKTIGDTGIKGYSKDKIYGALASFYARQGLGDTARQAIENIADPNEVMSVAFDILNNQVLSGEVDTFDQELKLIVFSRFADKLGIKVKELIEGKTNISKHLNGLWLQKCMFIGVTLAQNYQDFSMFERSDIADMIFSGFADQSLDVLATIASKRPESKRLTQILLDRINMIFLHENMRTNIKNDGFVDSDKLSSALTTLLTLRSKELVKSD